MKQKNDIKNNVFCLTRPPALAGSKIISLKEPTLQALTDPCACGIFSLSLSLSLLILI